MNITAIIIIYNSNLESSQTINCLLKCDRNGINLHTIIWNNGPSMLSSNERAKFEKIFEQEAITLSIYEDTRNIALSKIYNTFIDRDKYDFFTILDQDSVINEEFFQNIKVNSEADVIVPLIYSKGWRTKEKSLCFPIYAHTDKLLEKPEFLMGEIESISSGLTLSNRLIQKIKQIRGSVFNTKYALYAIDTSFFLDLKVLEQSDFKGLCIGKIDHSLDFSRQTPDKISPSRMLEMEYSNVLNKIYYKKKKRLNIFFYLLRKFFRHEYSLRVFAKLTKCLITKKHPRSYFEINID